ncbi:MAG: hypothetical protein AMXMBFR7_47890 [Planctomycetota bacterium]
MARKAEEQGAMAARRMAREEGWRKHLKAWGGSGLSQAEYCRRHGVMAADFSWWKRELARRDQARRPKQAKFAGFVPVRLPVAPMGAGVVVRGQPEGDCEVLLRNGRCLRIGGGVSIQRVVELAVALESGLPC